MNWHRCRRLVFPKCRHVQQVYHGMPRMLCKGARSEMSCTKLGIEVDANRTKLRDVPTTVLGEPRPMNCRAPSTSAPPLHQHSIHLYFQSLYMIVVEFLPGQNCWKTDFVLVCQYWIVEFRLPLQKYLPILVISRKLPHKPSESLEP